ncbi:MAG: hypothetical protein ABSH38_01185 [Verrucomicrobiota bacterium]
MGILACSATDSSLKYATIPRRLVSLGPEVLSTTALMPFVIATPPKTTELVPDAILMTRLPSSVRLKEAAALEPLVAQGAAIPATQTLLKG